MTTTTMWSALGTVVPVLQSGKTKAAEGNSLYVALIAVVTVVVLLMLFLWAWKTLYKKPSADEAFVRTGMGGVKVFKDNAGLVIGLFHHLKWISLETMRLVVSREDRDAMITKDRLRVDMTAEFYIRVQPEEEQILRAARSLGEKSLSPDSVKHLVEAKLVGALRSVAATRQLVELHENRDQFADAVQEALRNDLAQNGLTLEAVAIVKLDMTDKSIFDPNNIFDAVGLKSITDITEKSLTDRNLIERNRQVERKDQDVDAEKKRLELDRSKEFAAAEQYKQVETYRAEQEAETQRFRIEQDQSVRERDIERERAVKEADIEREQRVREADIAKETYLVAKQQEREQADIHKDQVVEVSRREAEIQVLQKEREKELEAAKQLEAVAEKERAAQQVLTVEKTEEAERQRQVLVIGQKAESEKGQIEQQIAADAEAYEVKVRAAARLEAAENQAQAIERLARAKLADAEAIAAGEQRLIEARNATKNEIIVQDALIKLADKMPSIVAELMKPAEKISEMRVLNISGMGGGDGNGSGSTSPIGGILKSFLEAGAALPMFKEMLKMANVDADTSVTEALRRAAKAVPGVQKIADLLPEQVRSKQSNGGQGDVDVVDERRKGRGPKKV